MTNGVVKGIPAAFTATELLNDLIQVGPQPQFTWATDSQDAVVEVLGDTLRCEVTVPDSETATEITVTASCTDPLGVTVEGTVTVPIIDRVYTVQVTQAA